MNRKAAPVYFNGEKYVMMSSLPQHQGELFGSYITTDKRFRPMEDAFGGHELVSYANYEFWYDLHYLGEKDLDQLI